MARVIVVGAGVSGLSSAYALLEAGHQVEVIASNFTPRTTSDVAAALWWPFHAEPVEKVMKWCMTSFGRFAKLAEDDASGVVMCPGILGFGPVEPPWAKLVPGGTPTPSAEVPAGCTSGLTAVVPMVEMDRYMPWLQSEVENAGARFTQREVTSLDEVGEQAGVVVNCSGLGARVLADDAAIIPARGRVVRLEQSGVDSFVGSEAGASPMHVFPRKTDVIVGGTYEPGVEDLDVVSEIDDEIVARATAADPRLRGAKRLGAVSGLRPTRFEVRLEVERVDFGTIVHNYGHGGGGVTLSWGCAEDVKQMVQETLGNRI